MVDCQLRTLLINWRALHKITSMPRAKKKKPNWGTCKAKQLMAQDMMDGIVPVDTEIVDVEKLFFELYANEPEF